MEDVCCNCFVGTFGWLNIYYTKYCKFYLIVGVRQFLVKHCKLREVFTIVHSRSKDISRFSESACRNMKRSLPNYTARCAIPGNTADISNILEISFGI